MLYNRKDAGGESTPTSKTMTTSYPIEPPAEVKTTIFVVWKLDENYLFHDTMRLCMCPIPERNVHNEWVATRLVIRALGVTGEERMSCLLSCISLSRATNFIFIDTLR